MGFEPMSAPTRDLRWNEVTAILSYASPGWYLFLCDTLKKELEVYYRSACRVISGCPVVVSRIAHPPLEITLNHQALAFCERTLRLPADNFPLNR